jgi:hypothetical protein
MATSIENERITRINDDSLRKRQEISDENYRLKSEISVL